MFVMSLSAAETPSDAAADAVLPTATDIAMPPLAAWIVDSSFAVMAIDPLLVLISLVSPLLVM
ncbi:hypothetical protein D3C83_234320 [compost metagenome]